MTSFHFENWLSNWEEHLSVLASLSTETKSSTNEKCNMVNTTIEKQGKILFLWLVNAMGFLKLVKSIWISLSVYQFSSFFFFKYQSCFVVNGKEKKKIPMKINSKHNNNNTSIKEIEAHILFLFGEKFAILFTLKNIYRSNSMHFEHWKK